jgi:hypothetical protein
VAEGVAVACVEHDLDRLVADSAAAQPHQRAQARRQSPCLQQFARRERVEVAREQVEALAVLHDPREQRAHLAHPPPLGDGRVYRAQVDAVDAQV